MELFSEDNSTQVVQQRNAACKDPRTRRILDVITAHLHEIVRELEPTRAEWEQAIAFLTRTGQMCSDKRQEFILLSDTLGVSMLVDAINHRREGGGTESTVLGPFYVPGAQRMPMGASISKDGKGEPMLVEGRVLDRAGRPIADATLDVWQAAPNGFYDTQDPQQPAFNLRGVFATGADGRYRFTTVKPSSYPIPDDGPVGLKGAGRRARADRAVVAAHPRTRESTFGCRCRIKEALACDRPVIELPARWPAYGLRPCAKRHAA